MKKNFIIGTALICSLAAASCSQENKISDNSRVALQVTSGIQTRAYNNFWENGDAIGIYMLKTGTATISENADNRRYSTTDGSSTFSATADQTIYFPVDGSNVDFIAYYPHQRLSDGSMTIDVSNQTNVTSIDLMTAKVRSSEATPYNKNNYEVAFNFSHKLTKLELNIANGTGLVRENLIGLKVEITNQRTEATYSPLTETLDLTAEDMQNVTLKTAANGLTAEAILLPNSTDLNPPIADRELVFTLTTGEIFRYTIPVEKSFGVGDRNIYDITINRSGVSVTATIENWNPVDNGQVDAE